MRSIRILILYSDPVELSLMVSMLVDSYDTIGAGNLEEALFF